MNSIQTIRTALKARRPAICLAIILCFSAHASFCRAQLSYRVAPDSTATYEFHIGEFGTVELPLDVTIQFSEDVPASSLTARIEKPIIGVLDGTGPPFLPFPILTEGSRFLGKYSGALLESQYLFDWSFELHDNGELLWNGTVGWAGGRFEMTTIASVRLIPVQLPMGDYDLDGSLNAPDINWLTAEIRANSTSARFDANRDGRIDASDRSAWVHELARTSFGDANLDGRFRSDDLVLVFQAGQYEDALTENSSWETGDWSGDTEFSSSDLVLAFQDGAYLADVDAGATSIPEPATVHGIVWSFVTFVPFARRRNYWP